MEIMVLFGAYLLIPNLFQAGQIEQSTFMIFTMWGILGFIAFRALLLRDKPKRFGRSLIVWIALLLLVLFIALLWMSRSMMTSTNETVDAINKYFIGAATDSSAEDALFINDQMRELMKANTRTMLTVAILFSFAIIILLNNYTYLKRRERESEEQLGYMENIANTDPLTHVKSRHEFENREAERNKKIKEGSQEPFAIVVCDLNGLKYINDTQGHDAGDDSLVAASRMICDVFQHSPVYRIGGDEFAVVATGRDYEARADLIKDLFERSVKNIESGGPVVAAAYSDYIPGKDMNSGKVFARADSLMYETKKKLKDYGAKTRD